MLGGLKDCWVSREVKKWQSLICFIEAGSNTVQYGATYMAIDRYAEGNQLARVSNNLETEFARQLFHDPK